VTYGITVKSQGGQVEITGSYGDVPDGTHEISGHEGPPVQAAGGVTARDRNVQVTRRDAEGRKVIAAQHYDSGM
jgi:hypothetical protein